MKTKFLYLFVAFFVLASTSVFAQSNNEQTIYRGDVNADGVVDAADIVAVINVMKNAGGVEGSVSALKLSVTKKTFGLNGGTVSITATPTHNMSIEPTVNWSATGGTLSAKTGNTVTFTAPKNTTSSDVTYTITAECGGKTVTCTVTVVTTDAPPVQYYWYVGWTKPTTLDELINVAKETPASHGGSTDKLGPSGSTNKLLSNSTKIWNYVDDTYTTSANDYYYVVIPNGYNIYDATLVDIPITNNSFKQVTAVTIENHKVYQSNDTARSNSGLEIY